METDIVKNYLEKVLQNRLRLLKIKEKYIEKIKENIGKKMYSLLYHWKDIKFRKAILITGIEEGFFYEPDADIDIKNFVVVTIRNSYLEDIFSVNYKSMELDKPCKEKFVKVITGEAIEYFRQINFEKLSNDINKLEIEDVYGDVVKQFPLAWEALLQLGNCTGKKVIYEEKSIKEKVMTNKLNESYKSIETSSKGTIIKSVESGISKELALDIADILRNIIKDENGIFYTDSFKMATRNFEKLLYIIEILLENRCGFLTTNFFITNSYIGKRNFLLRASHTIEEMKEKPKNPDFFSGLSKTHKEFLKKYVNFVDCII